MPFSLSVTLRKGDRVKIEGLGTFYLFYNCIGTEKEKDCTVRNIRRVNVRFKVDKALKMVNDATSPTRGNSNVQFFIKGDTGVAKAPGNNDDENEDDPTA